VREVLVVVLLTTTACSAQITSAQRQLFAYDAKQPLDLKQKKLEERSWARITAIEYASPRGGRVTGFLVEPKATGKHPSIVFGHWGPGNATEFLPEAIMYARAGVVSVMIDYPWVRPAPWRKEIQTPQSTSEQDRDTQAQAVVELRRAFDLLLARPDIDPKRIAYVGHSYGAQWGAILTAIDRRMCATVLVGGVPNLGAIYLENQEPEMVALRQQVGLEKLKKHVEILSVLDAIRYIPHAAPIPLLFQFARYERYFDQPAMDRYYAAASQPKEEREYSSGHDLNGPGVIADRARWLAEKLRTPAMALVLTEEIPVPCISSPSGL
jgi:pimeloyl-ACP methyl ester carboxylesterase